MWEIIREAAGAPFEVRHEGVRVTSAGTYEAALGLLAAEVSSGLAALAAAGVVVTTGDGLLPEGWVNVEGIAMSEDTGDGRDFTDTVWTSRDPNVSTLPLMLQTQNQGGHYGAVWAGYFETISVKKGTPQASGRFYDNAAGIMARDMMLSKPVGISVDPGMVDAEFVCTEIDPEWGDCIDGVTKFNAYEIIGGTITPFPAFARAAIQLDKPAVKASGGMMVPSAPLYELGTLPTFATVDALAASAVIEIPDVVPAEWLAMPEPELGDPLLVKQPPRFEGDEEDHWAVPLTITDDGRVFGHVAQEGQCHIGYPNECVTAPTSRTGYAYFHIGSLATTEGSTPTGSLIVDCNHAPLSYTASQARNHYDNTGQAWADVRASDCQFGIWVCGVLRPGVPPEAIRVLRASGLSGDWRDIGGTLEMVTAQGVPVPGFPIARESIAASAAAGYSLPVVLGPGYHKVGDKVLALTSAGMVRRPCADCAERRRAAAAARGITSGMVDAVLARALGDDVRAQLARIEAMLTRLDLRTAPLRAQAAADIARSLVKHPA